jgi:hypothetical protein
MKPRNIDRPDVLRRRLTRGGLSIPVVLATLGSRPVLGAAPYNCTISGQMSGNTSSHGEPVPCRIGASASEVEQEAIANPSLGEIPFGSLTAGGLSVVPVFNVVEPTDPNAGGVACAQPEGSGSTVVGGTPTGSGLPVEPTAPRSPKAPKLPRAPRDPRTTSDSRTISDSGWSEAMWTPVVLEKRAPRENKPARDRGGSAGAAASTGNIPPAISTAPTVTSPASPCVEPGAATPTTVGGLPPTLAQPTPSKPGPREKAPRKTVIATTTVDRTSGTITRPATVREVLESRDGGLVPLGRAMIASFFNATQLAPDYPLTPKQVIEMFNAVYDGGTYQVNATTYWNRDQVQAYFESLFR